MRRGVQRAELASGADGIEGKPQFAGHDVRGAAGQNAEGYLAQRQAINNFVDGPIPATSQDHVNAVRGRGLRQFVRHGGPRRGRQLDLQPRPGAAPRRLRRTSRSRLAGRRPATGL